MTPTPHPPTPATPRPDAVAPPPPLRLAPGRLLTRWALGALVATLLMWLGSGFLLDSVLPYQRDPDLGILTAPPGHVHRFRREGWGTTRFGPHGIVDRPPFLPPPGERRLALIWGDSHVEGFRVEDEEKIGRQVNHLLQASRDSSDQGLVQRPVQGTSQRENQGAAPPATPAATPTAPPTDGPGGGDASPPWVALMVGRSGRAVGDYALLLEGYAGLYHPAAHVIVINNLGDVLPDGKTFLKNPYRLRPKPLQPSMLALRPVIHRHGLAFAWNAGRWGVLGADAEGPRPLRFGLGEARPAPRAPGYQEPAYWVESHPPPGTWAFLLDALRARTRRPLAFVYAPLTPMIVGGRVQRRNPEAPVAARFQEDCTRQRIAFLDLTKAFVAYHDRTGAFPRGFHNGKPGRGHLNAAGNRLVAEAIVAWLRSLPPAARDASPGSGAPAHGAPAREGGR